MGSSRFFGILIIVLNILFISGLYFPVININSDLQLPHQSIIDPVAIRQAEMLNTVVFVGTYHSSGSGTIIGCTHNDVKNKQTREINTYWILTNAHVVDNRTLTILRGADGLRGILQEIIIDYGVRVIVFNTDTNIIASGPAIIIAECKSLDLAILEFETTVDLPIVNLPSSKMLDQIRIFDEVYAVGCQLGRPPLPTNGIISAIVGTNNGRLTYTSNAQIICGSSGGGLFKQYGDHYYLIGIPFRAPSAYNGQFLPHLASAISLISAQTFISDNTEIDFEGE